MASSLKLSLTVTGQVGKVPFQAFTAEYELTGQTAGLGPQELVVPSGAAPASVDAQVPTLAAQNVLFICTDDEVTYQLNSDAVNRTIRKGGFVIHAGDPVITALAFGGNGSTDASVTIIQLGT